MNRHLLFPSGGGPFGGHATLGGKIVSHWTMDETSGTRVDSHGSNDLAQNGTDGYATGRIGNAFKSHAQGYLLKTSPSGLDFGDTDFAFTCWYYPRSVLVNKRPLDGVRYWLDQRSTNELKWGVRNAANSAYVDIATGGLTVNTWYFLYFYHDAGNDELGIQIDNGTTYTVAHSGGVYSAAANFSVGAMVDGSLLAYLQVDSLSAWNALLTTQERTDLYNVLDY